MIFKNSGKNRRALLVILLTSFLCFGFWWGKPGVPSATELLDQMIIATQKINTLKYTFRIAERVDGKIKNGSSHVKLQRNPRKLYLNLNGPEVLWMAGKNEGRALVNPNTFPYVNLNLDPMGSLMRSGQHHTIHEAGFDYFCDIIRNVLNRAKEKTDYSFTLNGEEKVNGRDAYKITITFPTFGYSSYTVKKDENMVSIARANYLSEYLILEANPRYSYYNDIEEKDVIRIPNMYAQTLIVFIDKSLMVPISLKIYDDKGLFEAYEHLNLVVNPKFEPEEFTEDYKEYNF